MQLALALGLVTAVAVAIAAYMTGLTRAYRDTTTLMADLVAENVKAMRAASAASAQFDSTTIADETGSMFTPCSKCRRSVHHAKWCADAATRDEPDDLDERLDERLAAVFGHTSDELTAAFAPAGRAAVVTRDPDQTEAIDTRQDAHHDQD